LSIDNAILVATSGLFWMLVVQFALWAPLGSYLVSRLIPIGRLPVFAETLADLFVQLAVAGVVLLGPLYVLGMHPLPIRERSIEVASGVIVGTVVAGVLNRMRFVKRR
jgi:hypothetical protein